MPGDLDGPQANVPLDSSINNFRFHPDYRIDRILFREIIGTVTDAFYIRPHVRLTAPDLGTSQVTLSLTGIASFALEASSTPGGQSPLGVELDPTIAHKHNDGFGVSVDHGVLFCSPGWTTPALNLPAKPAQTFSAGDVCLLVGDGERLLTTESQKAQRLMVMLQRTENPR
ncbi:MAG: hypothetical protein R3F14_23675 [Polyangiaceae bacterium]